MACGQELRMSANIVDWYPLWKGASLHSWSRQHRLFTVGAAWADARAPAMTARQTAECVVQLSFAAPTLAWSTLSASTPHIHPLGQLCIIPAQYWYKGDSSHTNYNIIV